MALCESLLPEFDQEMANTRKVLERIPEEKLDWKAHDKSMTIKEIASHLANLPTWVILSLKEDSFDMAPKDGPAPKTPQLSSRKEVLDAFDKNVADARSAIAETGDADFMNNWSLLAGGETLLSMPKIAVLRSFVMNHSIHHRAQLGVYLRLNDVPVPAIYGPTADEGMM
ncbi:MAG: DinB family protein [bacterium]